MMGGWTVRKRPEGRQSDGHRAFCSTSNCLLSILHSRAEPQTQGNSQVLLDAPIQLSKITENYGEMRED